ncbi:MAG TPA: hypothetical protein DEF51_23145 [Myxococcales bacterium]|nr:hypothetical protein [Myxococcales bacterium]
MVRRMAPCFASPGPRARSLPRPRNHDAFGFDALRERACLRFTPATSTSGGKLRLMSLEERIMEDLKAAMKAKDEVAKLTLRSLKADLLKKAVDLGRDLDESDELALLSSAVKSRRDSVSEYEKAERQDLADAEKAEIAVIERYLPKQLSEDEARAAIESLAKELGVSEKKQMGQLMKAVMDRYRGQIDGKQASRIAGSLLS